MVNFVTMKLREYLDEAGKPRASFAASVGVTVQALHRYLTDQRIPRRSVMSRIERESGGKVTAADFYGAPPASRTEAQAGVQDAHLVQPSEVA